MTFFGLSISAAVDNELNSVKIKLLTSGASWFRFVELDINSNHLVGMGEIDCDDNELLYTRTISVAKERGPKSTWLSNYQFTNRFECEAWIQSSIRLLHDQHAQISWNESGKPALFFLNEAIDESTRSTVSLLQKLKASYRTSKPTNLPNLYYTGSKTKYVYIFVHGLFMNQNQFRYNAEDAFLRGINSIVTVLPGHESGSNEDLSLYNEIDWIAHSYHLVEIARSMGEKVIVIGHSAGGLISFILGLDKQIDGAVLIQPAFGLTAKSSFASLFGGLAQLFIENSSNLAPVGGRMVARLISKTFHCSSEVYSKFCVKPSDYEIPTIVYADPKDDVVDTSAIVKIMRHFDSSQIDFIKHSNGHMYIPDLRSLGSTTK